MSRENKTSHDYDSKVSMEWKIKIDISKAIRPIKKSRDGVFWIFPLEGWIKINFYGAAKGNPRLAGCGGVIRDENGRFILMVALSMGNQINHLAKAIRAYEVLLLAHQIKCKKF